MEKTSRIFVAGHNGLVGSAVVRRLQSGGYENILTIPKSEVDLRDPVSTRWWFSVARIDYVFLCAAKVGGIVANIENPVEFFLENIAIQNNVMVCARDYNVKKLLFLGSSCIYPRDCSQPIKEEYLLTGLLEPTNEAYAIAKISGVKLCQWMRKQHGCNFVSAMPCNLFGIGDNFNGKTAHIIPGLISRMHQAKIRGDVEFPVWGNENTRREFLFSDDLADALMVVMGQYNEPEPINTGSGQELSVGELARIIAEIIGYSGKLIFDGSMPAGVSRKLLDNSKLFSLGWKPKHPLDIAIQKTYDIFLQSSTRR